MFISNTSYTHHFSFTRGQCKNTDNKIVLKNMPDISKMLLMIIESLKSLKFNKTNTRKLIINK